jgi:hypothetical protein
MTRSVRPSWLTEALADRPASQPPTSDFHIRPGQIRRLEPMDCDTGPRRLVLVIDVDLNNAFATVALLTPEIENGSDLDLVASKEVTGLTYDLLTLTDVSGPAWFVQLHDLVADRGLSLDDLPAAGIALRDDRDARWSWKEQELDEFIALTAECRGQLLDNDICFLADPVSFDLNFVDISDHIKVSNAATHMVVKNQLFVPAEVIKNLDVPNTDAAYDSMCTLRFTAATHKDRLLPSVHPTGVGTPLRDLQDDPLQRALASLITRVSGLTRCIKVTSVSALWESDPSDVGPLVREFVLDGRRHQIVVSEIDMMEAPRV